MFTTGYTAIAITSNVNVFERDTKAERENVKEIAIATKIL